MNDDEIEAVMIHEWVHALRFDNAVAALHMLVEAIFWFHPLVWWMERRLLEERERACDEAVVELGEDAETYAGSLLKTCRFCVALSMPGVAGVTGADLRTRVVRILSEKGIKSLRVRHRMLLGGAAAVMIAAPVCFGVVRAADPGVVALRQDTVPDWQKAAGGHMEFEVASVRPSDPGSSLSGNVDMNTEDYLDPAGGLFKGNRPLIAYIAFAYKLSPNQEQLKTLNDSLPKWASTQMFAVEARASSSKPTKDQFRLMMQSLLADRFKFVFHIEHRNISVFALTIVKPGTLGPNLRPHSKGPPCNVPASEDGSVPSPDSGTPAGGSDSFPFNCGEFNLVVRPNNMVLTASRDVTIAALAAWLPDLPPGDLGRPVVDQTGLNGRFDFSLKWSFVPTNSSTAGPANQPEFLGPTLEHALREQLGLYLKPVIAPIDFLLVDHVEMPSPN
jgi:bla regulator protein blaR1